MEELEDNYEQLTLPEQRIYVASLSDYNDGHLHGRWIAANQEPDEIDDEIRRMLKGSLVSRAEEWAIHDYEGFGAFELSEYENLETVSRVARGLDDHGPAFAHWVNVVGTEATEALDDFDDHYLGVWSGLDAYAENLLEDLGVRPDHLGPDWLQQYIHIDYQGLGEALASDLETADDDNGLHLFQAPES